MARPLTIRLTLEQVALMAAHLPDASPLQLQLLLAVKMNLGQRPKLFDLTTRGLVSAYEYEQLTDMTGLTE